MAESEVEVLARGMKERHWTYREIELLASLHEERVCVIFPTMTTYLHAPFSPSFALSTPSVAFFHSSFCPPTNTLSRHTKQPFFSCKMKTSPSYLRHFAAYYVRVNCLRSVPTTTRSLLRKYMFPSLGTWASITWKQCFLDSVSQFSQALT